MRGVHYQGDIAIDDVTVNLGNCKKEENFMGKFHHKPIVYFEGGIFFPLFFYPREPKNLTREISLRNSFH